MSGPDIMPGLATPKNRNLTAHSGPWPHGTGNANFLEQHNFVTIDGRVGQLAETDTPPGVFTNRYEHSNKTILTLRATVLLYIAITWLRVMEVYGWEDTPEMLLWSGRQLLRPTEEFGLTTPQSTCWSSAKTIIPTRHNIVSYVFYIVISVHCFWLRLLYQPS